MSSSCCRLFSIYLTSLLKENFIKIKTKASFFVLFIERHHHVMASSPRGERWDNRGRGCGGWLIGVRRRMRGGLGGGSSPKHNHLIRGKKILLLTDSVCWCVWNVMQKRFKFFTIHKIALVKSWPGVKNNRSLSVSIQNNKWNLSFFFFSAELFHLYYHNS